MNVRFRIPLVFGLALAAKPAFADIDYFRLALVGNGQWYCAALAELSETQKGHATDLFEAGYERLKVVAEARHSGILDDDSIVALGDLVAYLVPGPSAEFSLGYLWAMMQLEAHDETWGSGAEVNFNQLKELQMARVDSVYREKNCDLLVDYISR